MTDVPKDAREQLAAIAARNDALGGAKCLVPLWAVPLALRQLDLEAAAGEAVTEDFLEELAAAFFADWHAGVLGWHEAGDDNRAMMLQHAETAAAKFKPLLAAVRRDALNEAARAADRSRTRGEAVRAIRALGRPA